MGRESEKKPHLTANDPVDAATIKRLGELTLRRHQLGEMMLDIEAEKVKLLVENRHVEAERRTLFQGILKSRGLDPEASVEIDPENGKLFLTPAKQRVAEPQGEDSKSDAPPA
jgi:hypothetical protein